jgi:hypothetical protein
MDPELQTWLVTYFKFLLAQLERALNHAELEMKEELEYRLGQETVDLLAHTVAQIVVDAQIR